MSQEAPTKECFCNRSKGPYVKDVEGENRYEQRTANGTFSSETVALFSDIDKKYHNYRDPINIATFMNDLKAVFEKQGLSNFKLECTPCRTVDLSEITLVPNEGTVVYGGIEYTSATWLGKEGKGVHSLKVVLSVCAGKYDSDTMCTVTLVHDSSNEKQETDSAYFFHHIAESSISLMEKALKIKKVCQKII